MDNLGANGVGKYTSASNIGVYLWAVVAASDLELISRSQATLGAPCPAFETWVGIRTFRELWRARFGYNGETGSFAQESP